MRKYERVNKMTKIEKYTLVFALYFAGIHQYYYYHASGKAYSFEDWASIVGFVISFVTFLYSGDKNKK
jgi:hypothetical protein